MYQGGSMTGWLFMSVCLLVGIAGIFLVSVWESTWKGRKSEVIWCLWCLAKVVACASAIFVLMGWLTQRPVLLGEREEVSESIPIAALEGGTYISGSVWGGSFIGTGGVWGEIKEDDYYTVMVSDGDGGYEKRRYKADDVTVVFDSTEEDARVEEVDVVRDYDVAPTPFRAFGLRCEVREVEHQTRIHLPEGSYGDHKYNVN